MPRAPCWLQQLAKEHFKLAEMSVKADVPARVRGQIVEELSTTSQEHSPRHMRVLNDSQSRSTPRADSLRTSIASSSHRRALLQGSCGCCRILLENLNEIAYGSYLATGAHQ